MRFVLVLLLTLVAARDDELVRDFRRVFPKMRERAERIEAVLALDSSESPEVVGALLGLLDERDEDLRRAAVRVLAGFAQPAPRQALFAALAATRDEQVRLGLLAAAAEGGYGGGGEVLVELLGERSWPVRAEAARVLGRAGERELAVPALVPLAADKEPAVRAAALDALTALAADEVVPLARQALVDPVWQVRAAAAHALGSVRRLESIPLLIERLEQEEGRLREDLGLALEQLTARSFGTRAELWRKFWDSFGARFQLPTAEELAKLAEARAKNAERYRAGDVAYHGVETPSRRIVFAIDVSGSMEQEVSQRERFAQGEYPSFKRIDIIKTELARTIERLGPEVQFNILAFATEVKPWKKQLVPANALSKAAALEWIARLEPIGGKSKEDLARVGLVQSADLESGRTNAYGALLAGLGAEGPGGAKDDYRVEVDTLFFLTDGQPSAGEVIEPEEILTRVRELNRTRRVVIHALQIGELNGGFLERLATENGGRYVDLGH